MENPLYTRIAETLKSAKRILIMTDERIDGDTLGSSLGLFHALVAENKNVAIFSPKPLPSMFTFLPGKEHIVRDERIFQEQDIDCIVVCDNADGAYLPYFLKKMTYAIPIICVDHHSTNPHFGTINLIEPHAPSTADVIYRLIRALHFTIPPSAAQCLLTGMCTDTILFSTQHTNPEVMRLASELITKGARLKPIIEHTMMHKTLASLKLWGIALARLAYDAKLEAIYTGITENDIAETKATEDDIKSLSEYLNEVLDPSHETVLVYYEKPDGSLKGSLRSRTRNVANLAATHFNGGGHPLAAGFSMKNTRFQKNTLGVWEPTPQEQKE